MIRYDILAEIVDVHVPTDGVRRDRVGLRLFPHVGAPRTRRYFVVPEGVSDADGSCRLTGVPTTHAATELREALARADQLTFAHIAVENVSAFVAACATEGETSDAARAAALRGAATWVRILTEIDAKRASP